jgi:hypothetical protein
VLVFFVVVNKLTSGRRAAQATDLKKLSERAFKLEAFKRNLDGAKAARRIAALQAKLRLMDGPPHTL